MINRREFLEVGILTGAVQVAAPALAINSSAADGLDIERMVYDTRFPPSEQFGRQASARGLAVAAIDGDMTRLWYEDLYHRWRDRPRAIAGLTAYGPMFCFAELAKSERMPVVFKAEHALRGRRMTHTLIGPAPMLGAGAALETDVAWGARMADIVARFPPVRARPGERVIEGPRFDSSEAQRMEPLYSWLIAPQARA